MGTVWLAEHEAIGRKVAIKVLHPEFAVKDAIVQRFFNEARAANRVQHSSIVDVYDYGRSPEVGAYLVMEYLQGESLAARLERVGHLGPRTTVAILRRVAAALGAAHRRDLVHRDLKPDNLFLVPDADHPGGERVKVLDFGVAKLMEQGERRGVLTGTGTVLGTPRYMSPEQCDGAKDVDSRSDVYSLGVIAYECLCGRAPFVSEGYGELMVDHITRDPPPLHAMRPEVPAALEEIVLVALAKYPGDRYQTMEEMADALADAVAELPDDEPEEAVGPAARGSGARAAGPRAGAGTEGGAAPLAPTVAASSSRSAASEAPKARSGARSGPGAGPRSTSRPARVASVATTSAATPAETPGSARRAPSTLSASAVEMAPGPRRPPWVLPAAAVVLLAAVAMGVGLYGRGQRGTGPGAAAPASPPAAALGEARAPASAWAPATGAGAGVATA
ncbi:MAG TPA: protein kinase, partial [Myxococcota bacterium]|nr:protein kinase [Myxococcota bacterium]